MDDRFHSAAVALPLAPRNCPWLDGTSIARSDRMEAILRSVARPLSRPLDRRTTFLCLAILALNLLDAFATLRHLEHGATELNPFMAALLHKGAGHFLVVKHLLASAGVLGIALHPGRRSAKIALYTLFPLYTLLAVYQIALFYVT
jgi:hypothetical protein